MKTELAKNILLHLINEPGQTVEQLRQHFQHCSEDCLDITEIIVSFVENNIFYHRVMHHGLIVHEHARQILINNPNISLESLFTQINIHERPPTISSVSTNDQNTVFTNLLKS